MGKGKRYHYFVEGEFEKKLISILKEQKNQIVPGILANLSRRIY